jgi:hypothetical protein
VAPFTGDIGIVANRRVRVEEGTRRIVMQLNVDDLGDLRVFNGLEEIDAAGMLAVPFTDPRLAEGGAVTMTPETLKVEQAITVGRPASLMLLKPASATGTYTVFRIIRGD